MRKTINHSTEACLLRLDCSVLLILRAFDLCFDLPHNCQIHDVLDVSSTLTENVMCAGLKYAHYKVTGVLFKPVLWNSHLEHRDLSWYNKILHGRAIAGVKLPSVTDSWIGNAFPPTSIRHSHKPFRIGDVVLVSRIWIQNIGRVRT